jgi:hypothetical protein
MKLDKKVEVQEEEMNNVPKSFSVLVLFLLSITYNVLRSIQLLKKITLGEDLRLIRVD